MLRISRKAESFTESVIREMNRVAVAHGAVSLAQGFPDFACPPELKRGGRRGRRRRHQPVRDHLGLEAAPRRDRRDRRRATSRAAVRIDPETQVTVTCGATEAMIAAMLGLLDPGDEVVIFEPYYENYGPDAILSGAVPRYVTLHEPDWSIDPDELRAAFGPRTRGIVVNSPHNPTGKVFSRDGAGAHRRRCASSTTSSPSPTTSTSTSCTTASTSRSRRSPAWPSGPSASTRCRRRTPSRAGGSAGRSPRPTCPSGIRRVHDFLTVGAAAPLQAAAVTALGFPDAYYRELLAGYRERRDLWCRRSGRPGFRVHEPGGAYYVMTDIRDLASEGEDDVAFAHRLIRDPGVAAVPGSSFFSRPELGRTKLRFAFPKRTRDARGRRGAPGAAGLTAP